MIALSHREACAFEYAAARAGLPADGSFVALMAEGYITRHAPKIEVVEPEDVPPPAEPITRPGDVWLLGNHRLMCGDAREDVDRLLGGARVDMVYTDPPYGIAVRTDYAHINKSGAVWRSRHPHSNHRIAESKTWKPVIGDDEPYDPTQLLDHFAYVDEVFLWGADYYAERLPQRNDGSWVVWDRRCRSDGGQIGGDFHGSHFELCWSKCRHQREIARIRWFGFYGRETEGSLGQTAVHPTQKPIALAEFFLERWGQKAETVADLYGGSGSTLLACERQGKRCLMMEIDPAYCDVIVARWENMTEKKAVLDSAITNTTVDVSIDGHGSRQPL